MKKLILTLVFSVLFLSCKSKSVTNDQVDNKTGTVARQCFQGIKFPYARKLISVKVFPFGMH